MELEHYPSQTSLRLTPHGLLGRHRRGADHPVSRQLVFRIDGIWEMRKQAKYLEAVPSSDPGLL